MFQLARLSAEPIPVTSVYSFYSPTNPQSFTLKTLPCKSKIKERPSSSDVKTSTAAEWKSYFVPQLRGGAGLANMPTVVFQQLLCSSSEASGQVESLFTVRRKNKSVGGLEEGGQEGLVLHDSHFFEKTSRLIQANTKVQRSGGRSLRKRKKQRAFVEQSGQKASQAVTCHGAASATHPLLQVKTQRALT